MTVDPSLGVLLGKDEDPLLARSKPGKNDKNGHSDGPFPAIFQRPPETPPPPAGASASAQPAPGTLVGANGQEYISG